MELKYNEAVEVSKKQYDAVTSKCSGIVAHREENGKYYIKVWLMSYVNFVIKLLKENSSNG